MKLYMYLHSQHGVRAPFVDRFITVLGESVGDELVKELKSTDTKTMYRRYIASLLDVHANTEEFHGADLKNSKKEPDLSESVKLEWESEQDAMKKKLILFDSKEVTGLMEFMKQEPHGIAESDDDVEEEKAPAGGKEKFYIAGVDISFVKGDDVNACAALVILSFPELQVVYEDYEMIELRAPYIPGFLGFREVPFLCNLFDKLRKVKPHYLPQVMMVDGNGILHPKEFGSACHLGVSVDTACIGVAKKLFQVDGLEKDENHQKKIEGLTTGGDTFPLVGNSGKILGMALRSCNSTKNPIYVSQGHKISLESSVKLVHRCCKHRVPEPVRLADINSREYLRVNFKPPHPPDKEE